MLTPFLLVMLTTALILLISARTAADLLIARHYDQKADFFRHFPVQAGDIVFLGDSITDGCNWDELFPGLPVKNRGINADTTSGVLRRVDEIFCCGPAAVFLMIGTNDLAWIEHRSDGEILANYAEILRRIRTDAPFTRVFVQSILPRARRFARRIRRLNQQLSRLAAEHECVFIDLYPQFANPDGSIRADLSNDRLHLMGEGYELWAGLIRPEMDALRR
jgi:lysophospholipase L1-like esterase